MKITQATQMKNRNTHTGKNKNEKAMYKNSLENIKSEPTINEQISFPNTTNLDELQDKIDTAEKTIRKSSIINSISEHLRKNLITYVFTALISIGAYLANFVIDSKVNFEVIKTKLNTHEKNIEETKSTAKENQTKNSNQDVQINENKTRIEYIEKNKK